MTAETPETAPLPSTTASGQRNVAVGGEVRDSTIITGDSNTIIIGPRREPRKIPWRRILLVTVPVLAVALAVFVLYPRPVAVMRGDLNVAVAEFGALDARGVAIDSAEARALAESMYATLGGELRSINQATAAAEQRDDTQIWVWGPSHIGRIAGNTPQQRALAAEQIAARTQAHLLIYGYLDQTADATRFVPQFYLRNLQDTPELEGQHDLGQTVAVRSLDDPASRSTLRANLLDRTRAFAEFVIGVSQFSSDKFAVARVHFSKAETDPQWDDRSGKEVLYMFEGYTAGKLGDNAGARKYFERALAINPEFARAYLGLGEVQFQESLGKPEACARDSVKAAGIHDAIKLYQHALNAKVQPARSNVPTWTALSLGRAYVCLSQADAGSYWSDAERELSTVIADYEADKRNPALRDPAAEAHSNLGFVYLPGRCDPNRQDRYRAAAQEYQRAIDLSPFHTERQGFYYAMLGFIHGQLGALDQSRAAYRDAMRVDPLHRDQYQLALDSAQQPVAEGCP
jgi:tetratricopeptide (TPR) repeat protein